ncbi:MAG: hypothetical protein ACERKN_14685 [Velocimicrobium sp.]
MENKKYTLKEIKELLEIGEEYQALEKNGRIIRLPLPLGSLIYRVIPDCTNCTKVEDKDNCKILLRNTCKKKVMPGVFTIDLFPDYGKTVFGTESEAVVASVSS